MKYHDLTIEASDVSIESADQRLRASFKVRVLASPAGEMTPDQALRVECDMQKLQSEVVKLEARELEGERLIALGRTLGLLLLPLGQNNSISGVRELFARSLDMVGADAGLRLRLRLPRELAAWPWEYTYIERVGAEDTMAGFVALDPRVAIVRHEALPVPAATSPAQGNIKIVAALASPPHLAQLDLEQERLNLAAVLEKQEGIEPIFLDDATLDDVQRVLAGASIFHFAGHGNFEVSASQAGTGMAGKGWLALKDQNIDAEQLGITLRGHSICLAVLGACKTGSRDSNSVWGGIAPALCRCDVPAVVANQFSIKDKCAVAFSRQFYRALVGGHPIERAVAAGRIAAFHADRDGRDWGVPVLYLRTADGELFKGASNANVRTAAHQGAEADVVVHAKEVAAGGVVVGAGVTKFLAGKLRAEVTIAGTVYGAVTGARFDEFTGGTAAVKTDVDVVGAGGKVTGVKVDRLGR
jgi:CHAT domain-containing protein